MDQDPLVQVDGRRTSRNERLQDEIVTEISGERRSGRRYTLHLHVQYKLTGQRQSPRNGSGKTIDLSSAGIAFTTNEPLPIGSRVELSISWPVLLNQDCPLKLVVAGKVVRSDARMTAVRMERYEFRTLGLRGMRTMAAIAPS